VEAEAVEEPGGSGSSASGRAQSWRSQGGAGPRPTAGTVVEESGVTGGGGHVDMDDRVREEGSEWGRARGFG
jgi:hypothetical protein